MKLTSLPVVFALSALVVGLATTSLTAADAGIGPSFTGPVGLQLYSFRDSFKTNVTGSLDKVQKLGFKYAELAGTYGLDAAKFKALLAERGITPIATHIGFEQWRDNPEAAAAEAEALGLKFVGCAWIPHQGDFDEKTCREAIAVFNRAGEALAKRGMKFFYHVHGYEFQPFGQGTLFDLLMTGTDPKTVSFEMDIFWIVFPGQDPVKLLKKYGHRWELMHLKDMRKGLKTGSLSGGTDVTNDVACGEGQMDLPAILKAAKQVGVKWYFIEDESPSVEQQLPVSLRFLETVKF
jgi:sugar phosphate isomerase/epimerase